MNNAETIWQWLWERIGNAFGVAGLMGNLQAESALRPDNLQNSYEKSLGMTDEQYTAAVDNGSYTEDEFVHDRAGYGLAQWTYWTRKRDLYLYAKESGRSIGNLEMQLEFLMKELGRDYKSVLNTLLNAESVREASDAVILDYERPADTSVQNRERRAALGEAIYAQYAAGNCEDGEISTEQKTPSEGLKNANNGVVLDASGKAALIISTAESLIGCKYVFGALGQIVDGRPVFDCRGYTWYLLHQVGISISTVGATTQWNTVKDWAERGEIKGMPNVVCCVFKKNGDKMSHTGMHIGDGMILHCTSNGGVKYGSTGDSTWTHYAIPKGLYTAEEIERGRGSIERTLRQGMSGEDVREAQEMLNALGYDCGTADGVFGAKTAAAVKAFQGASGLYVDGVIGPKTREALRQKYGGNDEQPQGDEKPVLKDSVEIPLELALRMYRTLGDALGLSVDTRSGNISNIDYQ